MEQTIKALECNIQSLIELHPQKQEFLKKLTNMAIDNAIVELQQQINKHTNYINTLLHACKVSLKFGMYNYETIQEISKQ